jgi:hypothetical protein
LPTVEVQQIERVDDKLASSLLTASFEQSEKVRRTVGPRKAELDVNYCRMCAETS